MNIDYNLKKICHMQGYQTVKNKGVALIGMSPGNSYFTQSTISELIDFSATVFSKIYIVVPDKPSEHTFKALGYTQSQAQTKAQKNSNNLKNRVHKSWKKFYQK